MNMERILSFSDNKTENYDDVKRSMVELFIIKQKRHGKVFAETVLSTLHINASEEQPREPR